MKRRTFLAGVLAVASLPRSLAAQTAPKIVRIGWLTAQQASSLTPYLEALRAALAELGYVEGRNLTIEFRFGDDDSAPVSPHNAPFPTYKAPRVHHAHRRCRGFVAARGARAATGHAGGRVS